MPRSIPTSMLSLLLLCVTASRADDPAPIAQADVGCPSSAPFGDVWIKVFERQCLTCHHPAGDAAESALLLVDVTELSSDELVAAMATNAASVSRLGREMSESLESKLLAKSRGDLDHGGGAVLSLDSTEYRLLQDLVRDLQASTAPAIAIDDAALGDDELGSVFNAVTMIDPPQLLRRITLSLAGRLPTSDERDAVTLRGNDAVTEILDGVLSEPAFHERLLEGFNDILLTLGYEGNGEDVLSYDHFETTRHWYQTDSLDHLPEDERERARYRLADRYREALRREPLELIRYLVTEGRPFTELVTADFTMVSPYTARGYGVFDQLRDRFVDPEDPFEFIPTQLPALRGRDGRVQATSDGNYPHAGVLSMFQYLRRFPTTETNRNRLRARMVLQHFLGVDIMNAAPRVADAAAVDAQYAIPTMQAAECIVCHRTVDPIAGLFQDYYNCLLYTSDAADE